MGDAAVDVEEEVGRAAADVDDGDADLLLVLGEHRLGAGERLEHDVGDVEVAALGAADDVLHAARRGGDEVDLRACRRTPLMPIGSRMPSWLSTMYSRGKTWRIWRSASTGMARAPSSTRSRSARVTSPPAMAATPSDAWQRMWLPATPA